MTIYQFPWEIFVKDKGYDFRPLLNIYDSFVVDFSFICGISSLLIHVKEKYGKKIFNLNNGNNPISKRMSFIEIESSELNKAITRGKNYLKLLSSLKIDKKVIFRLSVQYDRSIKGSNKKILNPSQNILDLIISLFSFFQLNQISGSILLKFEPYRNKKLDSTFYRAEISLVLLTFKKKPKIDYLMKNNSILRLVKTFFNFNSIQAKRMRKFGLFTDIKTKINKNYNFLIPGSINKNFNKFLIFPLGIIPKFSIISQNKWLFSEFNTNLFNLPGSTIPIGYHIQSGVIPLETQTLSMSDLSSHISCFGLTSQGKSRFLYQFLHQVSKKKAKFLIFDLKGEYFSALASNTSNFFYFQIGSNNFSLKLNIFEIPNNFNPSDHINFIFSMLGQVIGDESTPQMLKVLYSAIQKTVISKGSFKDFINYVQNPKQLGIKGSYLEQTSAALVNRLLPLTSGLAEKCFNVEFSNINYDFLLSNNIILDLSLFEEIEANITRKIFVNMLYHYLINHIRKVRGKIRNPNSISNLIVVEEAQKIVPIRFDGRNEIHTPLGMSTWTTRSYGVCMVFVGTDPILESSIINNTGVTILFYGKYEKNFLLKTINEPNLKVEDILDVLRERQYFILCKRGKYTICRSIDFSIPSKSKIAFKYFHSFQFLKSNT